MSNTKIPVSSPFLDSVKSVRFCSSLLQYLPGFKVWSHKIDNPLNVVSRGWHRKHLDPIFGILAVLTATSLPIRPSFDGTPTVRIFRLECCLPKRAELSRASTISDYWAPRPIVCSRSFSTDSMSSAMLPCARFSKTLAFTGPEESQKVFDSTKELLRNYGRISSCWRKYTSKLSYIALLEGKNCLFDHTFCVTMWGSYVPEMQQMTRSANVRLKSRKVNPGSQNVFRTQKGAYG